MIRNDTNKIKWISPNGVKIEEILEFLLENPRSSQEEIGMEFGISRPRVNQILKKGGISRPCRRPVLKCRTCDKIVLQTYVNQVICGDHPFYLTKKCEICGKERRVKAGSINMEAGGHGTTWETGRFCSRQCHGKWLGRTYGFGRSEKIKIMEERQ